MAKLNVVVILAESLRQDHCGCYGNTWIHTPHLDRLAARATTFTRCYAEALASEAARRAMLTGRRSFPDAGGPPTDTPSDLSRSLAQAGYWTGMAADISEPWARAMNLAEYTVSPKHLAAVKTELAEALAARGLPQKEDDWPVARVYGRAMELLRENASKKQPFYLTIKHAAPAPPWAPLQAGLDLYDCGYEGPGQRGMYPLSGKADWLSERQLKHLRALYAGEVTLMDAWLGLFLNDLAKLGLMDKTLIVFAGDHGVALGEHGLTGYVPTALYPELTDIPAIYYDPESRTARTVGGLIYNIDLIATVLNRIGVAAQPALEGIDVRPMIEGGHGGRPYLTSIFGDSVWIRTASHVLIAHRHGSQFELYELANDAKLDRNVAEHQRGLCEEMFALAIKDAGIALGAT